MSHKTKAHSKKMHEKNQEKHHLTEKEEAKGGKHSPMHKKSAKSIATTVR